MPSDVGASVAAGVVVDAGVGRGDSLLQARVAGSLEALLFFIWACVFFFPGSCFCSCFVCAFVGVFGVFFFPRVSFTGNYEYV